MLLTYQVVVLGMNIICSIVTHIVFTGNEDIDSGPPTPSHGG